MNPLAEQRVHLTGNPIKSQGELLLCFPLIISSLPRTAANALLLLVCWDGGAQGKGRNGQFGAKRQRRRRPSHFAHCSCMLHRVLHICQTFLNLFFFLLLPPLSLSPLLFLFFTPCPSLLSTRLLVPFFNLLFIAQQVMKNLCPESGIEINAKRKQKQFILTV